MDILERCVLSLLVTLSWSYLETEVAPPPPPKKVWMAPFPQRVELELTSDHGTNIFMIRNLFMSMNLKYFMHYSICIMYKIS